MFGNNDITNELKIISNEINALKHELAFVKEQQTKELELLNDIMEGLRYVYRTEKENFSEIKSSITSLGTAPLSTIDSTPSPKVESSSSAVQCVSLPSQRNTSVSETLTDKFNRVINNITSLADMPEEFKSIGLKSDGNKFVPINGTESYFITKSKDSEYYLYPSVQVKSRRGQETTEEAFDYIINGSSLITVKKPCRLLKFEYGYKLLGKGTVQID